MNETNNNGYQQTPTNNGPSSTSAFSGGTKVTFNNNGTYSSGQRNSHSKNTDSNKSKTKLDSTAKRSFTYAFLGALAACVLVIIVLVIFNAVTGKGLGGTVLGSTNNTAITQSNDADTLPEAVANKCLPSVVAINVYTNQSSSSSSLGGSSSSGTPTLSSKGSGVVISNDGYVITNHHVIDGASLIKVNVGNEEIEAELKGADESSDVAVIKLKKAENLVPIEIADSSTIKIGE